jgi:hypothetical protein
MLTTASITSRRAGRILAELARSALGEVSIHDHDRYRGLEAPQAQQTR